MLSCARRLAWLSLALVVLASPAAASVGPSPTTSTVDPVVVGDVPGNPSPFHVIVRDSASNPLPGVTVGLGFNVAGIHAYNAQNPPLGVNCPVVFAATDVNGQAVFQNIRFGGYANTPAITVMASGITLRTVMARSADYDDSGDVDLADFNVFRDAFLNHPTASPQSDFNNNGPVDLGDLNLFRLAFLNNVHGTNCP